MPITRQQYFNPKQIGGSVLWLDGADPAGTGTAPANGSTLTTWVDKSGAGRTLIVGSGTTTYANNAITLANSYMYVTSAVDLTNFSFFIIAKTNSATNNQTVFGARPNTATVYNSSDGFGFYMDFQTAIRFYGNSAGLSSFSATTIFSAELHIVKNSGSVAARRVDCQCRDSVRREDSLGARRNQSTDRRVLKSKNGDPLAQDRHKLHGGMSRASKAKKPATPAS